MAWIKWVFILAVVASGAWIAYDRLWSGPADGPACERDRDCRGGVCLRDAGGRYCTRACEDDGACLDGWRCLEAVERRGRHCLRPAGG